MMIGIKKKSKRKAAPKKRRVHKIAAGKRAANPLRKYDGDFIAGWEAGHRAIKRNSRASLADAARPWATAKKTYGSTWMIGFGAAIDHYRFGKALYPHETAKRLGLLA